MKTKAWVFLFVSVLLFPTCAFYWDIEPGVPPHSNRIVFRIEPIDTQILLDGRFIGEAFEFSTPQTALRLRSRDHEIILKKEGFIEEVIDLRKFMTRNITIKLTLKPEKGSSGTAQKEETVDREKKPEYIAKTLPVKEPDTGPEPEKSIVAKMVQIDFEILPAEAAIYLNGKFWGIAPEGGKIQNQYLKAGTYAIEVIKPEYKGVKKVLELKDQKQLTVTITLEKEAQDEGVIL